MYHIDWKREPNIEALRSAQELLATDTPNALLALESLAEQGSVCSMWYLADAYSNGEFVTSDLEKARLWYTRAADAGWTPAFYLLGRTFLQAADEKSAFEAFSQGAAIGYLPSMYRLAKMHEDGCGTVRDIERSRELLQAATIRGHLFAKRDFAILYLKGSFDLTRALKGLRQLMSLGSDLIKITISRSWRDQEYEDRILA